MAIDKDQQLINRVVTTLDEAGELLDELIGEAIETRDSQTCGLVSHKVTEGLFKRHIMKKQRGDTKRDLESLLTCMANVSRILQDMDMAMEHHSKNKGGK